MVDGGKLLVEATYRLEGDAFLAPFAFDMIDAITIAPGLIQFTNLEAVMDTIGYDSNKKKQKLDEYASMIIPAYTYIADVFNDDPCLKSSMLVFKGCRWLLPTLAKVMDTSKFAADVAATGLLAPFEISGLQSDLPKYLQLAHSIGVEMTPYNLFEFFMEQRHAIKWFYVFATRAALLQPSSAASERVFSMLEAVLGDNMGNTLSDNVSSRVMIRYNYLWRNK